VALAGEEDAAGPSLLRAKPFDDGPGDPFPTNSAARSSRPCRQDPNGKNDLELLEVEDSGSTIRKAKEDIYLSARRWPIFPSSRQRISPNRLKGLSSRGSARFIPANPRRGRGYHTLEFSAEDAVWKLGPALAAATPWFSSPPS